MIQQSVIFLAILLSAGIAAGQSASPFSQQGVLLLRNGEVIRGQVTAAGDRFDVRMNGGEIRVRASDVEFRGQSMEECYAFRRAHIELGKIEPHLELAEWCLRQNLPEEAAAELQSALAIDSTHPKLGVIERRLKLSLEQAPPDTAATSTATGPTLDELDRLIRSMPPHSVELYTSAVQPLLMNHCSTGGCHGPQAQNSLRLQRIPLARLVSRRTTQRNLAATLDSVNREHPEESPLLLVPLRPHGGMKAATFTSREITKYKQLVEWVYLVSNAPSEDQPRSVDATPQPLSSFGQSPRTVAEERPAASALLEAAIGTEEKSSSDSDARKPGLVQRGAKSSEYQPKDPFDPEVFNRKYFGAAKE